MKIEIFDIFEQVKNNPGQNTWTRIKQLVVVDGGEHGNAKVTVKEYIDEHLAKPTHNIRYELVSHGPQIELMLPPSKPKFRLLKICTDDDKLTEVTLNSQDELIEHVFSMNKYCPNYKLISVVQLP